jgi:hypothetical protein
VLLLMRIRGSFFSDQIVLVSKEWIVPSPSLCELEALLSLFVM